MYLQDFLDRIKDLPRDWELDSGGRIRNRANECPATAVLNACGGEVTKLFPMQTQQDGLELPSREIMHAADNHPMHLPSLRHLLLEAVGL